MIERTERRFGLKPERLLADTAYGTGKFLGWLVGTGITPHIPVWEKAKRDDGTFSRSDFTFDKQKNEYRCPTARPCVRPAEFTMVERSSIGRASSIAIYAR